MSREPDRKLDQTMVDAAFICDLIKVRDLLARGADPNARDDDGRTPLFSGVLGGSIALIGLLLESGADVNARDNDGWTALHFAAQEDLPEMARLLLAKGADVNACDNEGGSVLWRAVFSYRGHDDVVRLLRQHGAKDNVANVQGETARALADRLGLGILTAN